MSSFLFLSPYPTSAPSHRVRLEQYVPYLHERGSHVTIRSLLDERAYRSRGWRLGVAVALASIRRLDEALHAGRYDVVLVHREALPLPTALVERLLDRLAPRLVFDFDDAIYLPQPYTAAPFARWLRSPKKFGAIVGAADEVIAGNRHLADRARPLARHVTVIPSTVDTDRISPAPRIRSGRVVIGWMGSPSTARYLEAIAPALRTVIASHPRVEFDIVGARVDALAGKRVRMRPWSVEREVEDLRSFDIGIMPLPNDEWARGKCGYKALQYMAAGVATISSPVGVATEIVAHELNGLLVNTEEEWVNALATLIEDSARRDRLGSAGRETVVERYSVRAWAPRFYESLRGSGG